MKGSIMGMSTHVVGVRDLDGAFARMADVKAACDAAKCDYPKSVVDYFGGNAEESIEFLKQEMEEINIDVAITQEPADSSDVWRVDISKLPSGVKAIRFSNSY